MNLLLTGELLHIDVNQSFKFEWVGPHLRFGYDVIMDVIGWVNFTLRKYFLSLTDLLKQTKKADPSNPDIVPLGNAIESLKTVMT